jgi:hypothetical protein
MEGIFRIYVICLKIFGAGAWAEHLLRVYMLLCNDSEMGGYIRQISGQRLDKHVPTATGKMGCSQRGPPRGGTERR